MWQMFNKYWLNTQETRSACGIVQVAGVFSVPPQQEMQVQKQEEKHDFIYLGKAKDLAGFHLSKFGVVLLPVFIQKLFGNLSRKHKEGSLMSLFKFIHILDNPQWRSAEAESPSAGTLSLRLPFGPTACLASPALGDTRVEPDSSDK